MKTIADILQQHSFFYDLNIEELSFIAGCGKNVIFKESDLLAKPGENATTFYLIKEGLISLAITPSPGKSFIFQTLGPGEIVGLSWLIPPYLWTVSAQAASLTKAIAFDGTCIRQKCEKNPELGFKLMKQLIKILVVQEEAYRLHLLDVYGGT